MSYSSEVLADSPLCYYRMGDSTTTALPDSSGNSRNMPWADSGWVQTAGLLVGDADAAISTGGASSAFISYQAWMHPANVTVEAWIKPASTSGSGAVVERYGTSADSAWMLYLPDGIPTFLVRSTAGDKVASAPTALVAGSTYHVVGTFDGTNIRTYVNGSLVATTPSDLTATATAALRLARWYTGSTGAYYNGVLDEVAVYATALTPERISAHYAAGTSTGPEPASATLTALLPALGANLAGGIEFSGTIAATLPPLGANLSGSSVPAGIAGDLAATLPPLGGSLAGAYSDTGTLAAILPPLSADLAGTYAPPPVTGTLSATLPGLAANLAGQAFEPGTAGFLAAALPALTASLSGDVLGRAGLGLALDSSAVLTVEAALEPEPSVPPGTPSTALHIIAPTVPVPTLVAGRPQ